MREIKILVVVLLFTFVLYMGVEPIAHYAMHGHKPQVDFSYKDVQIQSASGGDAKAGKELFGANCASCHSIKIDGFAPMMDDATAGAAYGVVPPDLSSAGGIYSENFLASFIKDPVKAIALEHKFTGSKIYPMPAYGFLGDKKIKDIVAYLKSIAPKTMSNKEVYADACQRCHDIKYADFYGGSMSAFSDVSAYMGTTPPDLSQYIRIKGRDYLMGFINNPDGYLHGTAMPRVGLTKDAAKQVVDYLEEVGDSSKPIRDSLGWKFLIYFAIIAIFAWIWKARVMRDIH